MQGTKYLLMLLILHVVETTLNFFSKTIPMIVFNSAINCIKIATQYKMLCTLRIKIDKDKLHYHKVNAAAEAIRSYCSRVG
ncbi:hypothetical protein JHK84_055781 [Glycine max]|nr:hypothetical protein JHK86_055739 [Glycine max]KAG4909893.1 hypothetical protein JHK87_056009 [Glycine soja]KAG4918469.1 hypothetical protein JHK85_056750 [Glycine max]KAG5074550.1 hypothetical protein JHK84_055781 [Glycine max]